MLSWTKVVISSALWSLRHKIACAHLLFTQHTRTWCPWLWIDKWSKCVTIVGFKKRGVQSASENSNWQIFRFKPQLWPMAPLLGTHPERLELMLRPADVRMLPATLLPAAVYPRGMRAGPDTACPHSGTYSAIRGWTSRHRCSVRGGHMLCDSVYMNCPEQVTSVRPSKAALPPNYSLLTI